MIGDYLQTLVKVLGIGASFASIPLFASLAALEPPWPPAIGFVSSALILLGALVIWEWTRKTKIRKRRRAILAAAVVTVVSLFGYLFLYSLFIETVPLSGARIIRGYECTADALLVYGDKCPNLSATELEEAGWDNLQLWTRSSITAIRLGLTAAWVVFTVGLIMAVGAVVAGRKF